MEITYALAWDSMAERGKRGVVAFLANTEWVAVVAERTWPTRRAVCHLRRFGHVRDMPASPPIAAIQVCLLAMMIAGQRRVLARP